MGRMRRAGPTIVRAEVRGDVRVVVRSVGLAVGLAFGVGCGGDDPEPFTIRASAGLDGRAFDGTPAVDQVELRVRGLDGVERALGRVSLASGALEVPDAAKDGYGALVLAGLGGDGATLAYGRTPSLELAGLQGRPTVGVSILVQRVGTIARALRLDDAPARPRCSALGERYALVFDAASTSAQVVDLLALSSRAERQVLSAAPTTVATSGATTLALDASGGATLVDFAANTVTTPSAPDGAAFADVVGGSIVLGDDGAAWLVGATRSNQATDLVLRLDPDGKLSARRLLRARRAAAATWVPGRGLLVAYGEPADGSAAGEAPALELVAPGASTSAPLPFPAPMAALRGGILVALDGARVLRIAEDGAAATFDLSCASACAEAPTSWKDDPRAPRDDDHATAIEGGGAVVVRGGRVSLLGRAGDRLVPLHDAGAAEVCTQRLSIGSVAVVVAGEDVVRTVAPPRP